LQHAEQHQPEKTRGMAYRVRVRVASPTPTSAIPASAAWVEETEASSPTTQATAHIGSREAALPLPRALAPMMTD